MAVAVTSVFDSSSAAYGFTRESSYSLNFVLSWGGAAATDPTLLDPSVATDLPDYAPNSTAYITASDFEEGATVAFQVLEVVDYGADGILGTSDDVVSETEAPGDDVWFVTDGVQFVDAGEDGELGTDDDVITGDLDGVVNGVIETSWYVDPFYGDKSMVLMAAAFVHKEFTWASALGADTTVAACAAAAIRARWRNDRLAASGWLLVCAGLAVGRLMGIYSFGGPVPAPAFIGDYNALPRVLLRDGHVILLATGIAAVALATVRQAPEGAT